MPSPMLAPGSTPDVIVDLSNVCRDDDVPPVGGEVSLRRLDTVLQLWAEHMAGPRAASRLPTEVSSITYPTRAIVGDFATWSPTATRHRRTRRMPRFSDWLSFNRSLAARSGGRPWMDRSMGSPTQSVHPPMGLLLLASVLSCYAETTGGRRRR